MSDTLTAYGTLGIAFQDVQETALNKAVTRLLSMMNDAERVSPDLEYLNSRIKVGCVM